ncbi:MAG: hypothetical protein AB7O32_00560 [Vicinamibacterales bacterium]
MATMTNTDYGTIRRTLYRGAGKLALKALPTLPSGAQLLAAFQAIETRFEVARPTLKNDIDSALGITTTAAQARWVLVAWLTWKIRTLTNE